MDRTVSVRNEVVVEASTGSLTVGANEYLVGGVGMAVTALAIATFVFKMSHDRLTMVHAEFFKALKHT